MSIEHKTMLEAHREYRKILKLYQFGNPSGKPVSHDELRRAYDQYDRARKIERAQRRAASEI